MVGIGRIRSDGEKVEQIMTVPNGTSKGLNRILTEAAGGMACPFNAVRAISKLLMNCVLS